MSIATMIDITARCDVRLMRLPSSLVTARRVISERPRSPCRAPVIHMRYWARKGRSSPSSWRARARASGLGAAAWSSCMMTASPGRMRTSEKIARETSHSTSSPCRTRRATYVRMPVLLLSELVELPARRLLRHPGRLGLIRAVPGKPAVRVRARVHVRLSDAVVRRHDRGNAVDVLPQVIPDGALDGWPLLAGIEPPRGEQIVQLRVGDAFAVDRSGERRVISQIDPVHEARARPDRAERGQRVREGLRAGRLRDPGRRLELLELHADARVAEESRDELSEFVEGPSLEFGPLELHVEPVGIARRGQELLGLLDVVLIVRAETGVRVVRALGIAGEGPGERPVQRGVPPIDHFG